MPDNPLGQSVEARSVDTSIIAIGLPVAPTPTASLGVILGVGERAVNVATPAIGPDHSWYAP